MRALYAIYDKKALDLVGGVQIHTHEAVAVRQFRDIALSEKTPIHQHLEDYDLIKIADISDDGVTVACDYKVVLTGSALLATTQEK